jgi:diguanylate cyclase (GGDEF)-like protein
MVMASYWVAMAAAAATAFLAPASTAAGTVAALLPGVVSAAAVLIGVRRNQPRNAWPWLLMAVALVLNALGDTVYLATAMLPGTPLTGADILYVATIPCILGAIASLGRVDSRSRARSSTADALTVTAALLLAGWTTLVHPLLDHIAALDQAALVLYPTADVLLIAGIVRLYSPRRRSPAIMYLAIGAASTFASDVAYAVEIARGTWHTGSIVDLGWLLFYAAWGAAGLHPSMAQLPDAESLPEQDVTARRLFILLATSLTGPAVLLIESITGQMRDAMVLALGTGVIVVLNLLRVADTLNSHRRWRRYTDHHDPLTGLLNRARFSQRLAEALARARHQASSVGVVLIDVDDFQALNNTLGEAGGDEVLVQVARRLGRQLGRHDAAARLGGDEFALLIPGASVEQTAVRLSATLAQPVLVRGAQVPIAVSMGVSVFPADQPPADAVQADGRVDLLAQAGLALRAARASGRGRSARYRRELHAPLVERMRLRTALDTAIAQEEFTIRYQPIVDLHSGATVGMEALVRWQHPDRGLLAPADFIDLAEESDLIGPIGDFVLRRAVAVAATWHLVDPASSPYVSVNISARQVREGGFADRVAQIIDDAGLPPDKLLLELTESVFTQEEDAVWADLAALRETGVRLALDDFGTGFSSLSRLLRATFDVIKIDKSFVAALAESDRRRALVDGIVYLAERLDISVIAEGIETDADRDLVRQLRCPYGQGYLYAKPLAHSEAITWLKDARRPPTQRSTDGTSLRA